MNTTEFNSIIRELSKEELVRMNKLLVYELRCREKQLAAEFEVGDKVSFESRKYGHVRGKITKVNQKTVTVSKEGSSYLTFRVSPSLLTRI